MSTSAYNETLAHIKDREGFFPVGYFPTPLSGVTIGIGIDLGQQTKTSLTNLGISPTIISKCEKYFGLKSEAEVKAKHLNASDLVLTRSEAEDLSKPFIMDSFNVAQPYRGQMNDKGLAVLESLRHWAGSLGSTSGKLFVNSKNANLVWNVIKDKKATNAELREALKQTLLDKTSGTAGYNRIKHEIAYLG